MAPVRVERGRWTALNADLAQHIDPMGLNKAHPEYPELAIKYLPQNLQVILAKLSLKGYRLSCSDLSPVGNRWWNMRSPEGKHLSGKGGRDLRDVVRRVNEHDEVLTAAVTRIENAR